MDGLLKCIKHRDVLRKRVKADSTNLILQVPFKYYRNFCNSLLQKLKNDYDQIQCYLGSYQDH